MVEEKLFHLQQQNKGNIDVRKRVYMVGNNDLMFCLSAESVAHNASFILRFLHYPLTPQTLEV